MIGQRKEAHYEKGNRRSRQALEKMP